MLSLLLNPTVDKILGGFAILGAILLAFWIWLGYHDAAVIAAQQTAAQAAISAQQEKDAKAVSAGEEAVAKAAAERDAALAATRKAIASDPHTTSCTQSPAIQHALGGLRSYRGSRAPGAAAH